MLCFSSASFFSLTGNYGEMCLNGNAIAREGGKVQCYIAADQPGMLNPYECRRREPQRATPVERTMPLEGVRIERQEEGIVDTYVP